MGKQMTYKNRVPAMEKVGNMLDVRRAVRQFTTAGVVVAATFVGTAANAQTWSGNATPNTNWTTNTNWVGNVVPVNTGAATITFSGTTNLLSTVDTNYSIMGLRYFNTAGSYTIANSGGSVLTIGTGGITDSSTNLETISSLIALGATQNWNVVGTLVVSGNVSGGFGFTKTAAGTLILTGADTFTGPLSISTGTVQIGNGGTTGSVTANISDGSLVNFDRSDAYTYGGVISSNGSVGSIGSGTLTLSGANTFSGGLSDTGGGSVIITGSLRSAGIGSLIVSNNSVLDVSGMTGATLTAGSLAGSGNTTGGIILGAKNLAINGGTTSFNGVISGTGSVTKSGFGTTLTLTGSNTFTGGLSISTGTVQLGNSGTNLADTLAVNVAAGGTLSTGTAVETIGSLAGTGSTVLSSGGGLNLTSGSSTTYSGVISGAGSLAQSGTGTLTLSGTNTFTGGLIVNSGTVQLGNSGTNIADTNTVTVNGSGSFKLGTAGETIGGLSGTGGTVVLGSQKLTLNGNTGTYAGVISGSGSVTELGPGTQTLTGANTFTGPLTISGAGTVDIGGGGTTGSVATTSIIDNANLIFDRSNSSSYAGVISGSGTVTKQSGGTLTLSGTNTYAGATTISGGTLNLTGTAKNSNVTINSGGTLAASGTGSGAGQAVNNITLNSGGTLDPGNASTPTTAAKLYANSATWNGGGVWHMLIKSSSAASDEVILSGALTKGGAGTYVVDFSGTTGADLLSGLTTAASPGTVHPFTTHYKVTLATFSSTNFSASDFTYENLASGYGGAFTEDTHDLYFTSWLLPEPGSAGMILFAGMPLAMVAIRRARRGRKTNK
jgi:autotransporter-associated beta strand protein